MEGKEDKLKKIVGRIRDLPTFPRVVTRIIDTINNPKSSASDVTRIISIDPALTRKILRIVNSPYYGFPAKISSIIHAVVILGFDVLKSIVLSVSVFEMFKRRRGKDKFDRVGFWKHSIGCAIISREIARESKIELVEEAFIGGLLHDIGKIVLGHYDYEDYEEVINKVKEKDIFFIESEDEILGFNHTLIGKLVAERWNLPQILKDTIHLHHTPPLNPEALDLNKKITGIVHLANILCRLNKIGFAGDDKTYEVNQEIPKIMSIDEDVLEKIKDVLEQKIQEASDYLKLIEK